MSTGGQEWLDARERVLSIYPKAAQQHLGDGWMITESGYGSRTLYHQISRGDYFDAWLELDLRLRVEAAKNAVQAMTPTATIASVGGFQVRHCTCPNCKIILSGTFQTANDAWLDALTRIEIINQLENQKCDQI